LGKIEGGNRKKKEGKVQELGDGAAEWGRKESSGDPLKSHTLVKGRPKREHLSNAHAYRKH